MTRSYAEYINGWMGLQSQIISDGPHSTGILVVLSSPALGWLNMSSGIQTMENHNVLLPDVVPIETLCNFREFLMIFPLKCIFVVS